MFHCLKFYGASIHEKKERGKKEKYEKNVYLTFVQVDIYVFFCDFFFKKRLNLQNIIIIKKTICCLVWTCCVLMVLQGKSRKQIKMAVN